MEKIPDTTFFFHLYMCGYSLLNSSQDLETMPHVHKFWQMNLCDAGTGNVRFNGKTFPLTAGDLVIFPPGVKHVVFSSSESFGTYSFKFDLGIENTWTEMKLENNAPGREERLKIISAVHLLFHSIFPRELTDVPVEFSVTNRHLRSGILESILYGIVSYYYLRNIPAELSVVQKIAAFVAEKNGIPVQISEIARSMRCSENHLLRQVRAKAGCSTKELVDKERIKTAKRFLLYSDLSIGALARHMGFTDVIYFCRFFRKYAGESPSAFRKRYS